MTKQYSRPSANILLEAAEIQEKKGQDYNNATSSVEQADYYPRGVWSILDVVNAKYLRMVSVLETMEQGGKINFESVEDSALDLINYASFVAAYMRGDVPGQSADRDVFNKPVENHLINNGALIPTKFRKSSTISISTTDYPTYSFANNVSYTMEPMPEPSKDYDHNSLSHVMNTWTR